MKRTILGSWIALCFFITSSSIDAQQQVVEIEVKGELRRVSESLIRSTIGMESGVELSLENVQNAAHSLWNLNVFEDIRILKDDVAGGVKLIFEVVELPALEGIRFKGHKHVKEKDMREALGLVVGQVIGKKDMARGRQKILDLYKEKGYLRAEIAGQLFEADEEGKVFLQYEIKENEKVKVKEVYISQLKPESHVAPEIAYRSDPRRPGVKVPLNRDALTVVQLKNLLETKEKRWWGRGEFKSETYEEDKQKLLAFYRSRGYQQAAIARDSIYYDESKENLFVYLEIDEGIQYRLGEVEVEGNTLFTAEELQKHMRLDKGDLYQFSSQELAFLLGNAYKEKGYIDTDVIPREQMRGDTIDVAFQIFEGEPWKIRRINISGNTKTREKVIRREIELRPGDIYQQNLMQESVRRIQMLGFFSGVQPVPQYGSREDKLVDLDIAVEERPTGQASAGAGYSDRDGAVGQIGLRIPNFRGMGQNLDFNWEFGTRREQFLVGFTEPWLFNTPTSLSIRVSTISIENFDLYDYRRNSVRISVGRRLKRPSYSSMSAGYELYETKYSNIDEERVSPDNLRDVTTSSFNLYYQRDTRNFPQFPTQGTLFSYKPEIATSFVAGDVDFHRHEVRYHYHRPSLWKFSWALETKVAIVDGFSAYDDQNISSFDRFQPGGVDWWDGQVRGYRDRSLGPILGGTAMMVINAEYRFPIAENQIYGQLFADAGNAWGRIGDLSPLDLRRSVGFGFRVMTPMIGMIGFDFGYGFDRKKVDGLPAGWQTHFVFGPQFF